MPVPAGAVMTPTEKPVPSDRYVAIVEVDADGTLSLNPLHESDLLGLTEIADAWGLSRQRVSQLTKRADFPRPVFRAKAGAFWLRTAVEEYDRFRQSRVERHYGIPTADRVFS